MIRSSSRLVTMLTLLALGTGANPAGAALAPGNYSRTLAFGGRDRTYTIHVPASYDGSVAVPLVLDFHGLGSNAGQQEAISGLNAVADREGFLTAHPQGVNNAWNAGICCGNAGVDDVGFVRAVVAAIEGEANIDPRRVYATGLSNGGAITQRLACDAADLFAATAPLAFPVPFRPVTDCQPSRRMPVGMFMGLTDVLVSYQGGAFPSAAESFALWHDVNGCAGSAPDLTIVNGQSRCETYTRCQDGAESMLCSIMGQSFGGLFFDGHILYANVDNWNLAEVVWSFLSRFTRPEPDGPSALTLNGRGTVHLKGSRPSRNSLQWTVEVDGAHGDGSWSAVDGDGNIYVGTYASARRRGRAVVLTPGDTSRAALGTALAALVTGGAQTVSIDGGASLRGRLNKKGELVRIGGKLVLRDTAGAELGTYAIRVATR